MLSQQYAALVALPLIVLAPREKRLTAAGSAVGTLVLALIGLLAVGSSGAIGAALVGSGNSGQGDTVVSSLPIHGLPLFVLSRIAPLLLSVILAAAAVRLLGRDAFGRRHWCR